MIKIKLLAKYRKWNRRIPRSKLRKAISKFNNNRCSIKMALNYQRRWHQICNFHFNNNHSIIPMIYLLKKLTMMVKHQDRDQEVLVIKFKELRGTAEQVTPRHENRNQKASTNITKLIPTPLVNQSKILNWSHQIWQMLTLGKIRCSCSIIWILLLQTNQ